MKRLIVVSVAALCLVSCGTVTPNLYYWGGTSGRTTLYESQSYLDAKKQSPEALCNLICTYEDMVSHPGGTRQVPPPGICAEYGYLLMQPSTADAFEKSARDTQRRIFGDVDYASFFPEKGKKMLEMEMQLYPESVQFLKPLLKRMTE